MATKTRPCHPPWRSYWPALGLIAALLLGFGRLVARPNGLIVEPVRPSLDHARRDGDFTTGNDLTRFELPLFLRTVRGTSETGRVPAWDPAGFGGRPLVGNPQAGLWYPPKWLAWWSGAPAALGWITVGHLLWGGLGTVLLARRLGANPYAVYVAGVGFCLSPYVVAHAYEGHDPHLWSVSWFPWAFAAALEMARGRIGGGLALAMVLAAASLTGHAQEAYYLSIALAGWGAFAARRGFAREGLARLIRSVAVAAGVMLLAIGLLAIEWLPARAVSDHALRTRHSSASSASRYALDWPNLAQLLSPEALGGPADYFGETNWWETLLSFGGGMSALAIVGLLRSKRRTIVNGWAALVLGSMWFAAGKGFGFFDVLYRVVPGMDRFRAPGRALFLATLGVAMLAGLGVEAIARRPDGWRRWSRRWGLGTLAVAAIVAAGAMAAKWTGASELGPDALPEGGLALWTRAAWNIATDPLTVVVAALTCVGFCWIARRPGDRPWVARALGGLAVAELIARAWILLPVSPPGPWMNRDPVIAALEASGTPPHALIWAREGSLDDLRAVSRGLERTDLGDSFQIAHAADLYEKLNGLFKPPRPADLLDPLSAWARARTRQAVLDRMGVARLVAERSNPAVPWPIVAEGTHQGRQFHLYKNPTALPRAYVVPRASPAPDGPSVVGLLSFVPAREAALMPADPLGPPTGARQPFTPASFRRPAPDSIEVEVRTEAPGLLVVAETWMPGWSALLDGRPASIHRANRAQMVVVLPKAGRHRIILRYEPPGLVAGALISGASFAAWLTATGWTLLRGRPSRLRAIRPSPAIRA